jgi:hypothetical protein
MAASADKTAAAPRIGATERMLRQGMIAVLVWRLASSEGTQETMTSRPSPLSCIHTVWHKSSPMACRHFMIPLTDNIQNNGKNRTHCNHVCATPADQMKWPSRPTPQTMPAPLSNKSTRSRWPSASIATWFFMPYSIFPPLHETVVR